MVFVEYKNASRQQRQQSRQRRVSQLHFPSSSPNQIQANADTRARDGQLVSRAILTAQCPSITLYPPLTWPVYHYGNFFTARAKYTAPPTPQMLASKANSRFATRILSQLSSSGTWSSCCLRTCSMVLGLASLQTLPMYITLTMQNTWYEQVCTMYTHTSVSKWGINIQTAV